MQAKAAPYKRKVVDDLTKLMKEYPIVGVVNMENLPTPPLQRMRRKLRETLVLRMAKRKLVKIVIDKVKGEKKNIEKLNPYLKGMPALIFTKENPFGIYANLKKSKSKSPAKAGQTAPNDIMVKACQTPFSPGPIIGELGALGLKTGVENGKVAIKEDKVVVKEGEVITANIAEVLTRLGIEPMEVGLNLVAIYEDGNILDKSILDIDEEEYFNNLVTAHRYAFNLAVEAGIPNSVTMPVMIMKAHQDARGISVSQGIITAETAGMILGRAESQASALKALVKE